MEIKFRGLSEELKCFVYGFYHEVEAEGVGYSYIFWQGHATPVRADSVAQFTGVYDKNGVEIYEGDIVNDDDLGKGIVIIQSGCFFMMYDAETNMEFLGIKTDKFGRLQEKRLVEVVGNIYENPELLSTPTAVL